MREDHEDLKSKDAYQPMPTHFQFVNEETSSRLSEPDPSHPAHELAVQMHRKLDQALKYSLKELDQLSASIEKYKVELTGRTQIIKDAISEHFTFTTEVMGFKEKADRRLEELANGKVKEAQEARPASADTGGDDVLSGAGGAALGPAGANGDGREDLR